MKLGDGCTTLASNGEIYISFTRDKWTVRFKAIVVGKLNSDIHGGKIKLHNKHIVLLTNTIMLLPQIKSNSSDTSPIHCASSIEATLPGEFMDDKQVFASPRYSNFLDDWPSGKLCEINIANSFVFSLSK